MAIYIAILSIQSNLKQALTEAKRPDVYPDDNVNWWRDIKQFNDLFKKVDDYYIGLSSDEIPTQHLILMYRSEIFYLINECKWLSDKERDDLTSAFEERLSVNEIHVCASLLHPHLIYLKAINEYLSKKN